MTDQPPPEKPPQSILPYAPPPGAIIISEVQFEELEERAQRKPVNPMPYAILALFLVLVAVVGSMALGIYLTRPTPIVWPTAIPTQIVLIPTTVTETRTPTLMPTLTPTKDIMRNFQVISNYYHLLSVSDNELAWNCLTLKFRRDSFGNDFEEFKAFWSRTGPVAVSEVKPEMDDGEKATALTKLYFYYEQRTRYYRFHLFYNPLDHVYQIDLVDNARPW